MNFNINIIKKQRFLKLHPHLFFKNYDVYIYIDSSFIIIGDLNLSSSQIHFLNILGKDRILMNF